jgi:hypothetical protein
MGSARVQEHFKNRERLISPDLPCRIIRAAPVLKCVARLKNLRILVLKLRIVDRPGNSLGLFTHHLKNFAQLEEVVFLFDEPHISCDTDRPSVHMLSACAEAVVFSKSHIRSITLGGFMTFNDADLEVFFSEVGAKQPGVRSLQLIRLSTVEGAQLVHLTVRQPNGAGTSSARPGKSFMSQLHEFSVVDCAKVRMLDQMVDV